MFDPNIVNFDPIGFNSANFTIEWNPNRNTSNFAGTLFLDNLGVTLDFTNPTYSLTATISNNIIQGNTVTYTLNIKNTNNADQGYGIPISISIPSGLSYLSSTGNYNNVTHKWTPILDSTGNASITLTFKSTGTGNQTINASVDNFPYSITKTSNIIGSTYTLTDTLPIPSMVVEGQELSNNITISTNSLSPVITSVNVPIPNGFNYVSSNGNGTYNPTTQIWTLDANDFNNQSATFELILIATTAGSYIQTISIGSVAITNTIIVQPGNLTTCNYVEILLPEDIIPYLNDGQTYFVSCNMQIVTSDIGSVHQGISDFCISTLTTTDGNDESAFDSGAFDSGAFQEGTNSALVETLGTRS